jgi:hypothetical protein
MAPRGNRTTSLWSVIESMQRRLEDQGLDRDVVDIAVARGLEALLDMAPPPARPQRGQRRIAAPRRMPAWMRPGSPAKA